MSNPNNAAPSTAAKKEAKKGLRRYTSLIAMIVLFLVFTVATLAFSAWVTVQQTQTGKELVVVTRQGRLVAQFARAAFNFKTYVDDYEKEKGLQPVAAPAASEPAVAVGEPAETVGKPQAEANTDFQAASAPAVIEQPTVTTYVDINQLPQEAIQAIKDLKTSRDQFDETLEAFEKGKTIHLTYEDVNVRPLSTNVEKKTLAETIRVWTPYKGLIDTFLAEVDKGKVRYESIDFLVRYTRLYNATMASTELDFAQAYRDVAELRGKQWQYMQLAGIAMAFLLFLGIVFGALRSLLEHDKELDIAHQEMSEIMASVNEGLFLVDKDLNIGGQYSRRLEEIIDQKDVGNRNLLEVLSKIVPQEDLDITQTFIDQLYSDWVVEDLIEDLNPLNRISYQVEDTGAQRFVDFKFFRVWVDGQIERILVSATDTTESVMLQASLDAQKEQEGRELEMLNIILNTNPTVLNSFIQGSMERLNEINQVLKTPETKREELRSKAQYIARLVHSIKGEASSLKLTRMVDICENFEDALNIMKSSPNLTGQDFLGLVVMLEDLYRLFDVLNTYNGRIGGTANVQMSSMQPENTPEQESRHQAAVQTDYLKQFVADIAKRTHKQAQLIVSGFESNPLSDAQWAKLKDIAIQLLRNAVVHGIETPEIRRQRNKPEMGTLKLTLSQQPDGKLLLVAEDDGNGINFEAIRNKAVALGIATAEQAAQFDQRQLINLMFSNGFSTASEETEDAGRGVGMDIIKDTIQKMGGRIGVSTAAEGYTRFSLYFPKAS